ncbi:MAG: septum formation protein Maf [Planctomycetes bacterium]|nr:septum formation protein Maf [Planctomycetota bacterium]
MSIVLASASPRRAELLRSMGVTFEIVASTVEEVAGGPLTTFDIAVTNACRKAISVANGHRAATVIGADTVVALENRLLGKPADAGAATAMLAELSGKTHEVTTGVCLVHRSTGELTVFAETTRVTFRRLTARQIRDYIDRVDVLDKAGAYAIQERGDELVRHISGSFTNVVGLPVERLREVLTHSQSTSAR